MITDNYVEQHQEIMSIISSIKSKLDTLKLSQNATDIEMLLAELSGKVKVHLAMEDKILYPKLLASDNSDIVNTAKAFLAEIGQLGDTFVSYINKWNSSIKIQEDPKSFVSHTSEIIHAIENRIEKEDEQLFIYLRNAS